MLARPLHEGEHVDVPPHPGPEPLEAPQRLLGVGVVASRADVAVDAQRVRPVGLRRDGGEALLLDQPARDPRPLAVELVRPV